MIWNSSWRIPVLDQELGTYGKYLILGVLAWIVILSLLQEGLREIREEQENARRTSAAARAASSNPEPDASTAQPGVAPSDADEQSAS